jgi:hypothetical protein
MGKCVVISFGLADQGRLRCFSSATITFDYHFCFDAHVYMLLPCCVLQSLPHRVEAAVICWAVTLDRVDNYWTVLYCLQVSSTTAAA